MNQVTEDVALSHPAPPAHHPVLNEGEKYAGIILGKDGEPDYRLILLPGTKKKTNFLKGIDWAASIGGFLPTRREQSLLFANLKEEFEPEWYWSSEQHASDSSCAWTQDFGYGSQFNGHQSASLCARAVRRVPV